MAHERTMGFRQRAVASFRLEGAAPDAGLVIA
jgi:hypothetical protein